MVKGSGSLRSSLPKGTGEPRTEEEAAQDARRLARRAWQERGLLLLKPEEIDNEWLRHAVEALAQERYGPRRSAKEVGND